MTRVLDNASLGLVQFGAAALVLIMGIAIACGGDSASETASTVSPAPTVPPAAEQASPALTAGEQKALDHLATELGVDSDDIAHIETEYKDWPDGSLGCPEPDTAYIQVIIPGYRYLFSHLREHRTVHAGIDGATMVFCK